MDKELASHLLDIGAVKLSPDSPYTWASGWKSPIYCDNRLTLSYPKIRKKVTSGLYTLVCNFFPGVTAIAGVATAGIPQAAWLADKMNLPMAYVRSKPKEHGMGNQIEGFLPEGSRVLVVEDLVSTGKSSLEAIDALRKAGIEVIGMVSIFTYGFDAARKNFEQAEVRLASIVSYPTLLDVAVEKKLVSNDQLSKLEEWRNSPDTWGR